MNTDSSAFPVSWLLLFSMEVSFERVRKRQWNHTLVGNFLLVMQRSWQQHMPATTRCSDGCTFVSTAPGRSVWNSSTKTQLGAMSLLSTLVPSSTAPAKQYTPSLRVFSETLMNCVVAARMSFHSDNFFDAQIQAMKEHGGLVLNLSSAYGFVPNPFEPIYAASKGNSELTFWTFQLLQEFPDSVWDRNGWSICVHDLNMIPILQLE